MTLECLQSNRTIRIIALILLCIGFVLRAQQYLFNRSLWMDEAMLALNIVDRSFGELAQPLAYSQGAPLGFLFIQKLAVTLLGNHDYILRLFPFIASVVSLFFFYHVVQATTNGLGRVVATFLFSVSTWLIYYASEAKQYSSDVMSCLLLLLVGLRCIKEETTPKDYILLTLAGTLALWLSHPALFVCCGVGLGLILDCFMRKIPVKVKWTGIVLSGWLVNFLLLYAVSFRKLSANSVLLSYWNDFFMPMPPWQNPAWFGNIAKLILSKPVGIFPAWFCGALIVMGMVAYLVKNRLTGIILVVPLLLTLLASGLHKYPFGDRLLLFAVPVFFLYIGKAVEHLSVMFTGRCALAGFVLGLTTTVTVVFLSAKQAIGTVRYPHNDEDIKSVLTYVAQRKQPGDILYIYYSSIPAFSYYAPQFGLDKLTIVKGIGSRDNPVAYMDDVAQLRGKGRAWFIFSHNYNWGTFDEVAFFYDYSLPRMGTRLDEIRSVNAYAFLYSVR